MYIKENVRKTADFIERNAKAIKGEPRAKRMGNYIFGPLLIRTKSWANKEGFKSLSCHRMHLKK